MKSSGIPLIALVAANSLCPVEAWIGRPLSEIPKPSIIHKTRSEFPPAKRNQAYNMMEPMRVRGGSSLEAVPNPLLTSLAPKVGIITSTLLYFSPMATVRKAAKDEALGDLNAIPLAIMAVSSICWLVYGLSIQDPYVTLSNVPGCIASIWYVTAVLPLLKGSQLQTAQTIVVALSAITINLWTFLSLTKQPVLQVRKALGLFASALFIVLSGSPLSTIKTVFSTKNSGSILTPLTVAQVTNTALWSIYGLAIKNVFVYGPNITGLGFGLIQLLLKIMFPSK